MVSWQATKLVELYKQSSDEWSNKSHELEGVIKALEVSGRQSVRSLIWSWLSHKYLYQKL